jgi:hypothetical protein
LESIEIVLTLIISENYLKKNIKKKKRKKSALRSSFEKPSWSWLYGSWIYDYLRSQCLSPLMLWVWIPLRQGVLDTTLCNKVCQWLATGWWVSPGTLLSYTNITEILLKVTLNTIILTQIFICIASWIHKMIQTCPCPLIADWIYGENTQQKCRFVYH